MNKPFAVIRKFIGLAIWLIAMIWSNIAEGGTLRLASIFTDHLVLQRNILVPVWGWGKPDQIVTVDLAGQTRETKVAADGSWNVKFSPKSAGGPYELTVKGKNPAAILKVQDVLVGEVWLCSGQSNMAWPVRRTKNAEAEIAAAQHPQIRHVKVPNVTASLPQPDGEMEGWVVCSPATVGDFTATGYYFARDLYQDLQVPIGLIQSSWGGTAAEAWTSQESLAASAELRPILERFNENMKTYPAELKLYEERVAKCAELQKEGKTMPEIHVDPGNKGAEEGWQQAVFDDKQWQTVSLPLRLENIWGGDFDGAAWFRKQVEIPKEWVGQDLVLTLGAIDDLDITYFNGEVVGQTGLEVPFFWITPRKYLIVGRLVKVGPAVVAVRVFDHFGISGFLGPASDMKLNRADSAAKAAINLAGPWRCQDEVRMNPLAIRGPGGPAAPMGPDNPGVPSRLYNAMIHPLAPYGLRGAIWYQGEANVERGYQYRSLLPALIQAWRQRWGQGDFPFYIVQLPNFKARQGEPGESEWAELREAQQMVMDKQKNTALACTIDLGDGNNIHPENKQDVGKRLALLALTRTYGKTAICSGPRYRKLTVQGAVIRLFFDEIGGGLEARGGKLTGFAIAGADQHFVWADAKIEENSVVVSSRAVIKPVAVRYAWGDNPECNLYNMEGLPAMPFRTDDWPGMTVGRQ